MNSLLDHSFCADFRQEIAQKGLSGVIKDLLETKSVNAPRKKAYLARECNKKKSFKTQVEEITKSLNKTLPNLRPALIALRQDILGKKTED